MARRVEVALGARFWPPFFVAIAALIGPPLVAFPYLEHTRSVALFAIPFVLSAVLVWPAVAYSLVATAKGKLTVDGARLTWWYEEQSGEIDLSQPFAVDRWVQATTV